MPKIGTNWQKIDAGDIISFRYQSAIDKSQQARTTSILVLNPYYPKKLKDGSTGYYVNGLKLESSNITVFTNKEEAWQLLSRIGWVSFRSEEDEIYRVQVDPKFLGGFGAREKLYNELKMTPIGKKAQFRSYLYSQARKSSVFYEPIKIPRDKIKLLREQAGEIKTYTRTRRGAREAD
jgi:hypothetical protein